MSREKVVRGVVSDGREWKFIILYLNKDRKGGGYKVSPQVVIGYEPNDPFHDIRPGPDIVTGILAHWVCHHHLSVVGCTHRPITDAALLR